MNYRSVDDLGHGVRALMASVGRVDGVVGIPRSGMLAASLFALYANVPLFDIDGYLEGRDLGHGFRDLGGRDLAACRMLVLDDSVATGRQLGLIRERIAAAAPAGEHIFAAVYASPEGVAAVDVYGEIVETPRVFEWNLFHHGTLESWCFDIDGVLCADPPRGEEDDADVAYVNHLTAAVCIARPTGRIGTLVSNRLEKHRGLTDAWLAANGIEFGRLLLRPEATAAERRRVGGYGSFKAKAYQDSGAVLFIESDWGQAVEIANIVGRAVFCTDAWTMIYPGQSAQRPALSRPEVLTELRLLGRARLVARLTAILGPRQYQRLRRLPSLLGRWHRGR